MRFSNKKPALIIMAAVFLLAFDRFLKSLALALGADYSLPMLGDLLSYRLAENKYIAFSLPLYGPALVVSIMVILFVLLIMAIRYWQSGKLNLASLLAWVGLGAASNLYDRFRHGAVIDYFDLQYFTIFNLADVMIVGGVFSILLFYRRL